MRDTWGLSAGIQWMSHNSSHITLLMYGTNKVTWSETQSEKSKVFCVCVCVCFNFASWFNISRLFLLV